MAIKKPKDTVNYLAPAVKDIVVNLSKYLNIDNSTSNKINYTVNDYTNKTTTEIIKELNDNKLRVITIGTGNKIINQYPNKDTTLTNNDLVVLVTNDNDKTMIDFTGLSYKESKIVLDLMGVTYNLTGYGYASNQNIQPGTKIEGVVEIEFKNLY